MSYEDPFGDAPAEASAPEAQAPVTNVANTARPVAPSEGKVVVTLKGGRDFDAPWIVVHADSVDDALAQVNTSTMTKLMEVAQKAAKHFAGTKPTSSAPEQAPVQQQTRQAPQGATQAPNGETRSCAHGLMQYKSGVSKAGNAYKLFSCTAPRESQCKAEYLR